MSYEEIDELLKKHGYILECYSPLEISNEDGDMVTGELAQFVIDTLENSMKEQEDD